ncbi:uncharacterized protein LOC129583466 [Paramacrobiotus metropolitanus]|uniref:uncharacterized protein LOC129583466 n=1 Tax=Paramacrobiotus metropolitanus TaxID=2943436 RepID=UPI0024464405|nr:uncharacterized protein LOC129583466 [Paramacrobiotus metropolitanus]
MYSVFCIIFFVLFLCLFAGKQKAQLAMAQKLSVEIISPGMINMASLTSMPLTAPAIDIGLEEIQRNYSKILDIGLVYLYNRSFSTCDEAVTGIDFLVSEYYYSRNRNANVTVFFFPGWNQLAVIGAFNDIALRDKTAYPNVIQAGPVMMRQIIAAFVTFLAKYDWKTVYIVYDKVGKSAAIAAAGSFLLAKTLKETNGFTVYTKTVDSAKDDTFSAVLSEIQQVARIVTFWGHADNLRKFMIAAHFRNMTTGDYAYMSLSPFEYATPLFGDTTWKHNDTFDAISFQSYRSLFVITATSSGPDAEYTRMLMRTELSRRSAEYYNYTYQANELPTPHIYTQYACMYLLGQLVEQLALEKYSLADKAQTGDLAKWFWGKTLSTPVGSITFDLTGERQIQLEIRQMNLTSGLFTAFLQQNLSAPGQMSELGPITWFGKTLPLDVPLCGFNGLTGICAINLGNQTRLIVQSSTIALAVIIVLLVAVFMIARKIYSELHLRSISWEFSPGTQVQINNKSLSVIIILRCLSVMAIDDDQTAASFYPSSLKLE